jgi:hypothetical protein
MKLLLSVAVCFCFALGVFGQGTIVWNPPTTPITTNGLGNSGPISGTGNYRFGLYVGLAGSSSGSLSLVGITTNGLVAGSYVAQSFNLPSPYSAGTTISLQVRGWSAFAGPSYESALTYALAGNNPIAFLGQSTVDTYTIGSPLPYRPAAFELTPVPEPSTFAFTVFGAAALLFGIRSRQKNGAESAVSGLAILTNFPSKDEQLTGFRSFGQIRQSRSVPSIDEISCYSGQPSDSAAVRWIACQFQGLVNPQVNLSSVMIRNPKVGNSLEPRG